MLKGITVSETAKDYPQIKSLQSKNVGDFLHWSIQSDLSTLLASPRYDLELALVSKYGRVQHPRLPSIELDDNTKAVAIFRFLPIRSKLIPIARLEVENIELTPSDESRIIGQLSAGIERKLFPGIVVSGGMLLRRYRPVEAVENQLSLDFRAQHQATAKGVQVKSELKFFPIVTTTSSDRHAFKDYIATLLGSVKFPLSKYLFLSSNVTLYRETRIGPWAYNMDVAVQLHRTWGKKP
jgi:hypothetical protein